MKEFFFKYAQEVVKTEPKKAFDAILITAKVPLITASTQTPVRKSDIKPGLQIKEYKPKTTDYLWTISYYADGYWYITNNIHNKHETEANLTKNWYIPPPPISPDDLTKVWKEGRKQMESLSATLKGKYMEPRVYPGQWRGMVYFDNPLISDRHLAQAARKYNWVSLNINEKPDNLWVDMSTMILTEGVNQAVDVAKGSFTPAETPKAIKQSITAFKRLLQSQLDIKSLRKLP